MSPLVLALIGGLGVHYLYTAVVQGWRHLGPGRTPHRPQVSTADKVDRWLLQAGLEGIGITQFAAATLVVSAGGGLAAFVVFGGALAAMIVAASCATLPIASYRNRRRRRLERAHEVWPRMIEEIRIMTGSSGRSIPQAVFEVGRRAPAELRPAFDAAHREWLLTTDFDRTLNVLKSRLADPTADATCETLLVAHQLGGADLDQRLVALAEDRRVDIQGRKDAVARQAGARFARWFTIVVPIGMGLVGMSIGDGRDAYRSTYGQALVAVALSITVICWLAASAIMRLPAEQRVFGERVSAASSDKPDAHHRGPAGSRWMRRSAAR